MKIKIFHKKTNAYWHSIKEVSKLLINIVQPQIINWRQLQKIRIIVGQLAVLAKC